MRIKIPKERTLLDDFRDAERKKSAKRKQKSDDVIEDDKGYKKAKLSSTPYIDSKFKGPDWIKQFYESDPEFKRVSEIDVPGPVEEKLTVLAVGFIKKKIESEEISIDEGISEIMNGLLPIFTSSPSNPYRHESIAKADDEFRFKTLARVCSHLYLWGKPPEFKFNES